MLQTQMAGPYCNLCMEKGEKVTLEFYQINLEEALAICPNKKCNYPIGTSINVNAQIVSRGVSQIGLPKRRRVRDFSRSTSRSSSRSSSPISSFQACTWSPPLRVSSPPAAKGDFSLFKTPISNTTSNDGHSDKISLNIDIPDEFNVNEYTKNLLAVDTELQKYANSNLQNNSPTLLLPSNLPKFDQRHLSGSQPLETKANDGQIKKGPAELKQFGAEMWPSPMILGTTHSTNLFTSTSLKQQQSTCSENVKNPNHVFLSPPNPSRVSDGVLTNKASTGSTANSNSQTKIGSILQSFPAELTSQKAIVLNDPSDITTFLNNHNDNNLTNEVKQKIMLQGQFFYQWPNKDALCWLDVAMCLLVHSKVFQNMVRSTPPHSCYVVKDLLHTYEEAQKKLKQAFEMKRFEKYGQMQTILLQTSLGLITVKTGGGNDGTGMVTNNPDSDPLVFSTNLSPIKGTSSFRTEDSRMVITTDELQKKASDISNEGKNMLAEVRERVWRYLYQKLKCEKGNHDSPVFALPLLFGEDPMLKKKFVHSYEWSMICTRCGYRHSDVQKKSMITLPAVPADFTMRKPYFLRPCFSCHTPDQRMEMVFEKFPPVFFAHFVDGLHKPRMSSYDFFYKNRQHYTVTGVIQYKQNPDHFVAWIRDPTLNMWMECDDLGSPLTHYKEGQPKFPPSQVHIVMWTCKTIHSNLAVVPPQNAPKNNLRPLKSALKSPKAVSPDGALKPKFFIDNTHAPKPSIRKLVNPIKKVDSSANVAGQHTLKRDIAQEKKDLIAKLISVPKKPPSVAERLEKIQARRSEFRQQNSLFENPEELAKKILARGLPRVSSAYNDSKIPCSLPSQSSYKRMLKPSFSGYVPKTTVVVPSNYNQKKTMKKKLPGTEDPKLAELVAWPSIEHSRKRKASDQKATPAKHVKISDSSLIIGPSTSVTGLQSKGAPNKCSHPVKQVMDELCEKLDVPIVSAEKSDCISFSLEDLFEGGNKGEIVKPIESTMDDMDNVEFDLEMFL